jgi:predicted TIM-barrel fold metal-dependent hydrolase
VHLLLKRLNKQANMTPWVFPSAPIDIFRKSIWVAPYYEEDLRRLADTITVDKILFGSDWPHGEGLADPMSFVEELQNFTPAETEKIVRGNAAKLLGLD